MDIDVSKCEYFKKFYETNPNGYGKTYENYCFLYKDKCDKYPQCIYRNKELQQANANIKKIKIKNHNLKVDLEIKKLELENALISGVRAENKLEKIKTELCTKYPNHCKDCVCNYYCKDYKVLRIIEESEE